jgi:hypothetical protein
MQLEGGEKKAEEKRGVGVVSLCEYWRNDTSGFGCLVPVSRTTDGMSLVQTRLIIVSLSYLRDQIAWAMVLFQRDQCTVCRMDAVDTIGVVAAWGIL